MIELTELSYRYPGSEKQAVAGIDFTIRRGEIFGFLGPSGAGKSSTQRILIGLLRGYGGRVRVMEKELGAWKRDYYRHVGVSFELPNLYGKFTALENLNFFAKLYDKAHLDPLEDVFLATTGRGLL